MKKAIRLLYKLYRKEKVIKSWELTFGYEL